MFKAQNTKWRLCCHYRVFRVMCIHADLRIESCLQVSGGEEQSGFRIKIHWIISKLFASFLLLRNLFFPVLLIHWCCSPSKLRLLRHQEHESVTWLNESEEAGEEAHRTRTAHQQKWDRICRTPWTAQLLLNVLHVDLNVAPPIGRKGTKRLWTLCTSNVLARGSFLSII